MPARSATSLTAWGNSTRSMAMTKPKTSPAFPQPKHLKICFCGLTLKEGVFSAWKGQRATRFRPARLRGK